MPENIESALIIIYNDITKQTEYQKEKGDCLWHKFPKKL